MAWRSAAELDTGYYDTGLYRCYREILAYLHDRHLPPRAAADTLVAIWGTPDTNASVPAATGAGQGSTGPVDLIRLRTTEMERTLISDHPLA